MSYVSMILNASNINQSTNLCRVAAACWTPMTLDPVAGMVGHEKSHI